MLTYEELVGLIMWLDLEGTNDHHRLPVCCVYAQLDLCLDFHFPSDLHQHRCLSPETAMTERMYKNVAGMC